MLQPLDGPSRQSLLTVTTGAFVIAKRDASALPERKVVTLQPLDGKIRVFFGDDTAPTLSAVQTAGIKHPKTAVRSYEASESQVLYLVAETGTVSVVCVERA